MANRGQPVNGRDSRLDLKTDGDLVLSDADGTIIWRTNTSSLKVKDVALLESGNLVLHNSAGDVVWESFDFPTDTLLPTQPLTKNTQLVSRMGRDMYQPGYYRLYFDNDNVLRLMYDGLNVSTNYWPTPYLAMFANGRIPYNSTRYAVFDGLGGFLSSDEFNFNASDYGEGPKRRLTMDIDGNLRLYSLDEPTGGWNVVWMALPDQCSVHGFCGIYGLCIYSPEPTCTCPPGFTMADSRDWFKGCRRNKELDNNSAKLVLLQHTDYYGYDLKGYGTGKSLEECKTWCMEDSQCNGFGYRMDGTGTCYPKGFLFSGYRSPGQTNQFYIKVAVNDSSVLNSTLTRPISPNCSAAATIMVVSQPQNYRDSNKSGFPKFPLGFVIVIAVVELVCITLGWWYLFRKYSVPAHDLQGHSVIPSGFKRFSFAELKKATNNFTERVGKGGFGTVFRGVLGDSKVVAVKRLDGICQSEEQFWAEVSMIGRVHHMHLVRMFGFCAEGDHRLLVYEYVANGSLEKYLFSVMV
eukprot:Gb_10921 [translate_table: standard]